MDCLEKKILVRHIVLVGFVCSVLFHYVMGNIFGQGYPYSTFLFDPSDRFNDFLNIYRATKDLNPFVSSVSVYFPFTYMLVYLLTFFKPAIAYILFSGCVLSFLLVSQYKLIPCKDLSDRLLTIFVLTALSYPVIFLLDRGNFEGLVFICLGLFLYFHREGRSSVAALFLSCAIAMKLYPAVFTVLLIAERRWKPLIVLAVMTVGLTVLSASLLEGGVYGSIDGLQNNLLIFKTTYLNSLHGLQHNSSIYVPVFLVASELTLQGVFSGIYPIVAIVIFALLSAYILFREDTYWKKIAILSYLIILLPQVSYDYKLIHIFLPFLLFLSSGDCSRFDRVYTIMFGLLLIPKAYYYIVADVSINGMLNALVMVSFIAMIIVDSPKDLLQRGLSND